MRRRAKFHLLAGYLAVVTVMFAAAAAHAAGWPLNAPWQHVLAPRLSATTLPFAPTDGSLPATPVGNLPQFAAENYRTHTLYVVNSNDNTVSVVNLTTCNSRDLSGCPGPWPTIGVGQLPLGVAVDEATDTVYVANAGDGSVSVIDGSTCNASTTSGCTQTPTAVAVGAFDNALIVDPVTNTVFVTNSGASNPGTVSVIDGSTCNGFDHSGCASQPEAAVSVGDGPSGIGINPRTHTIYVTNTGYPVPDGHTVSVIDAASCRAGDLSGCNTIGSVPVGLGPINLTIDPATNTIYLGDTYANTAGKGFITVLNGATCDAADQSGCRSDAHPIVAVGADPIGYAVDPNNNSVYVTNANDDTMSVINDTTCNAQRSAGCKNPPPTIAVPGSPSWPVVDPATHTIYVVDQVDGSVAVLNDASCNAETTVGCRHPAPTAPAGSFPSATTTDARFGTVYIGDSHAFEPPYTVSMIDTARCNTSDASRCDRPPRTLPAVGSPLSMATDQETNTIYVATDGPLQVIDGATCNATTTAGCGRATTIPAGGRSVAIDPSTNTIYTLNNHPDGSSGYISVIDGRHCDATDTSGCGAQTPATVPTVAVGNQVAFGITAPTVDRTPDRLAVDDLTHTLYVTNAGADTVSVIDISNCHAGDTSQCASLHPPAVTLHGAIAPVAIAVDPTNNTAYVTDNPFPQLPDAVSLIGTTHCQAADTSECATQAPPTIPLPAGGAFKVQVDPATHDVYVANLNDSSVSVIHGRNCNATDTTGCNPVPSVEIGSNPSDLTLDPANKTAWVPDFYDDTTSLIAIANPAGQ